MKSWAEIRSAVLEKSRVKILTKIKFGNNIRERSTNKRDRKIRHMTVDLFSLLQNVN